MPDLTKPAYGEPCNGCGVCCQYETCPLARLRYWQVKGPCPALAWSAEQGRYLCGMLVRAGWFKPLIHRWIAAGIGCDCGDELG